MGIQHLPFTTVRDLTQFAEPGAGTIIPANLVLRSSADEITGVADGGSLSGWNDHSGNDRHWTVAGTGSPKYRATGGPNSLPCVEVGTGGSDGYFAAAASVLTELTAAQQAEVFIVIKAAASSGNAGLWYFSANAFSSHYHYADGDTIMENFGMETRLGPFAAPSSLTQWRLYNVSAKSGDQVVRLDGTSIATGTSNFSMAGGRLGETATFNATNHQIAEILIFDRVLTTLERDSVEGQLAAKYGLTIS